MIRFRPVAATLLSFFVCGCVYDVSRSWEPIWDVTPSPHRYMIYNGQRVYEVPPEYKVPFATALVHCVGESDPGYLKQVEAGGDYPISGWFLSSRRFAVEKCMNSYNWGVRLNGILFP